MQVHVYALGTPPDEPKTSQELLAGSLFDSATTGACDPKHTEYLRQREAYNAVWFSYEDLDVGEGREVEECTERVVFGETSLFLSLDTLHRLQHFVQSFISTLEAHPLLSRGVVTVYCCFLHFPPPSISPSFRLSVSPSLPPSLPPSLSPFLPPTSSPLSGVTVIGDPRSKTELQFQTASLKILMTSRLHLINPKKQPLSPHSPSVPSLLCSCEQLQGKLILPTYSGNATAKFPHCRLLECSLTGLSIHTMTIMSPGLASLRPIAAENLFVSLPTLSFSYYQQTFGEEKGEGDTQYMQIGSTQSLMQACSWQLLPAFMVIQSWLQGQEPPPPLLPERGEADAMLQISLSDSTAEWSQNESERDYSLVLGGVSVTLTPPTTSSGSVPVCCSPSGTRSWNTAEAWSTGHRAVSPSSGEKAAELHISLPVSFSTGRAM